MNSLAPMLPLIWIIPLIGLVFVNIAFAIAVWADANEMAHGYGRLWFVAPQVWMFTTLIGGVFIAAIYWLMHRSTLAVPIRIDKPATPAE